MFDYITNGLIQLDTSGPEVSEKCSPRKESITGEAVLLEE